MAGLAINERFPVSNKDLKRVSTILILSLHNVGSLTDIFF
jgi:hypothetical protein